MTFAGSSPLSELFGDAHYILLSNDRDTLPIRLVEVSREKGHVAGARHWFCPELWDRLNIGLTTAENLYDAGLRTPEEVLAASQEQLLSIKGIGPKTLDRILSLRSSRA